jgi:hypothetical protein
VEEIKNTIGINNGGHGDIGGHNIAVADNVQKTQGAPSCRCEVAQRECYAGAVGAANLCG